MQRAKRYMQFVSAMLLALPWLAGCNSHTANVVPRAAASAVADDGHAQIRRAEVASAVYELAYSERQQAVFVAAPIWAQGQRDEVHRVLRLDPQTLAVQAQVELPHQGFGVVLDDAANRLYVGHGRNGFVSVIDTAANRIIKTLPLAGNSGKTEGDGAFPYHVRALRLDASGKRLYVPGLADTDSVLFVIDTARLEVVKTVAGLGFGAIGVAVDDRQGRIFVGTSWQGIKVVDAKRLEIIDTWETDTGVLYNLHYDAQANRLFGTDSGLPEEASRARFRERYPHVPLRGGVARIIVLDAAAGKELASLPTPKAAEPPLALQLDSQRKRLYVTNRGGIKPDEGYGTLSVYDTDTHRLLQAIPLQPHPNSLAFDARSNVLYVSVKNDGSSSKAGKLESVVRLAF